RRHTRFSRDWSSDVCSSDLSHMYSKSKLLSQEASTSEGVPRVPKQVIRSMLYPSSRHETTMLSPLSGLVSWSTTCPASLVLSVRSEERRVGSVWRHMGGAGQ